MIVYLRFVQKSSNQDLITNLFILTPHFETIFSKFNETLKAEKVVVSYFWTLRMTLFSDTLDDWSG